MIRRKNTHKLNHINIMDTVSKKKCMRSRVVIRLSGDYIWLDRKKKDGKNTLNHVCQIFPCIYVNKSFDYS